MLRDNNQYDNTYLIYILPNEGIYLRHVHSLCWLLVFTCTMQSDYNFNMQ